MNAIEQYRQTNIKEIALLSNPEIKFKIKKINYRTMVLEMQSPALLSSGNLKYSDDTKKKDGEVDIKSVEDNIKVSNLVIIKGVIEPRITIKGEEDSLAVDELLDTDYNYLVEQITGYSKEVRKSLESFREERNANNTGQDGDKIQAVAE
jgi:hypothetical protein